MHGTGLQLQRASHRQLQIVGDHGGGQPVTGIVRQLNGIVGILRLDDAGNGPEQLFLEHRHGRRHVGDHGGLEVVSFVGSAAQDARALRLARTRSGWR